MKRSEAIARLAAQEVSRWTPEQRADALLDAWSLGEEDPAWPELDGEVRRQLSDWDSDDERIDALDAKYDPLLEAVVRLRWRGVTNAYLSTCLRAAGDGADDDVVGDVEPLHPCPLCGFRTLAEVGTYDICRLCNWEDDGGRDEHAHSGPNHTTLAAARVRWLEQLALVPELLHRFPR